MRRAICWTFGLAVMTAASAVAQDPLPPRVELGAFAGYYGTMGSGDLGIDANGALGFGGRGGVRFGRFGLEADYLMVPTTEYESGLDATYTAIRIRPTLRMHMGWRTQAILGAGWSIQNYDTESFGAVKSSSFGGLLGVQYNFTPLVGVRVEGTYDNFSPDASFQQKGAWFGLSAGLSFSLARPAPPDGDRDMIADARDACPNTPANVRVDARGCPLDTDRDAVADYQDRCADTPAGVPVDANGCTRDADADGAHDGVDRCPNTPAGTPVNASGCPLDSDADGVSDNLDRCPNTPTGTQVDTTGCARDADGDGVHDGIDRCPNTPRGLEVDPAGCSRDTDTDGVPDVNDRCANTPSGTRVDAAGCTIPDTDRDGVLDPDDRCPNTARGARIDATGCPLPDTDSDGVFDAEDRCPNTPAGARVDARGCPQLFRESETRIVLEGVNFPSGSSAITATVRPILDRVAATMVGNPSIKVEVEGHTDNVGSATANRRLSQARADAVRAYLIARGVDASRVTSVGYGGDNPKVPNTSAANRAINRRVELRQIP